MAVPLSPAVAVPLSPAVAVPLYPAVAVPLSPAVAVPWMIGVPIGARAAMNAAASLASPQNTTTPRGNFTLPFRSITSALATSTTSHHAPSVA